MKRRLALATLEGVQRLLPIAAELGLSVAQLALAWVLRRPEVSSAIIGASRPEQVMENARASGVVLDPAMLQRIERALANDELEGDHR
jgi:aryl-alcohol dehydrogenase-like predicted oxidoreductase